MRPQSKESPTSPIPRRHRLPTPKHFDTLAGRTTPFSYDPEADVRFEACRRHEDIFTVDASSLDEPSKVRLLLHKLDAVSYEKFSNYILPRTPKEVSFDQAVKTLKDLFGPQQSLFGARYVCMKLVKNPKDDFATYAGHVNRECAKFKLAECDHNQFKCLIFVCGLHAPEDAFIRLKLLDKIEVDRNCTIQTFTEECKRLLNLRHDTKMIEEGRPTIHSIDAPPSPRRKPRDDVRRSRYHNDNNSRNHTHPHQRKNLHKTPLHHAGIAVTCTSSENAPFGTTCAHNATLQDTKTAFVPQPSVA